MLHKFVLGVGIHWVAFYSIIVSLVKELVIKRGNRFTVPNYEICKICKS